MTYLAAVLRARRKFVSQIPSREIRISQIANLGTSYDDSGDVIETDEHIHIYEIRPRADHHGVDLISDAVPYSPLWYRGPNAIRDAIGCAKHRSRLHDAVIRIYDAAGNVIETPEQVGDFKDL
jgi:hypothetical protein